MMAAMTRMPAGRVETSIGGMMPRIESVCRVKRLSWASATSASAPTTAASSAFSSEQVERSSMSASTCELCETAGGEVLHQAAQFRVVLVDDNHYPGFCRVIWQDHVKVLGLARPARRYVLQGSAYASPLYHLDGREQQQLQLALCPFCSSM